MRTFLIDLENVKNQGMIGIEALAAEDRVFIFYSENANSLSIPTIQAMNNSKATIDYVHLQRSGRNAMDFQIVALLGFLIGSERAGQFCIVSQDNGYLAPVEFFMDHAADQLDVHVLLSASIQKAVRKWNSLASNPAPQPRVMEVEPVVMEVTEQEEEAEPVAEELPETEEVTEAVAGEAEPVQEEPEVPVQTEPEEKEEKEPESKPEPKKPEGSRKASNRRGRPKKENVPAQTQAEETPVVEAKKEEKPEDGRNNRRRSKASRENKQIEVSAELLERISKVLAGHTEVTPEQTKVIGQALLSTQAKNEFYQFFRRALGVQVGGELYHMVRGDYEKLKAAAAVNRPAKEE